MYQGCNKTALCSQRAIAKGFYELLQEKEYNKITACEICKEANVSRQTFYSLFSSKENIVTFILSKEYTFNPTEECNCSGRPTLEELSKGFASFIIEKSDFIALLEKNNIIYLMQESLYESFSCCKDPNNKSVPCNLTIDFIAAGLTTIAKHYVTGSVPNEALSDVIYKLFSGELIN